MRQLHLVLTAKQTMNAIAQHRALADEKKALAEHHGSFFPKSKPSADVGEGREARCNGPVGGSPQSHGLCQRGAGCENILNRCDAEVKLARSES